MELIVADLGQVIDARHNYFKCVACDKHTGQGRLANFLISLEVLSDISDGLSYLHRNNIIHRDLNPKNILLSYINKHNRKRYNFKICDFVLSPKLSEGGQMHTLLRYVGDVRYIAPELENNSEDNFKADNYSMGKIASLLFEENKIR